MELQIKNDNPKCQTLQQKQNIYIYIYSWHIYVYTVYQNSPSRVLWLNPEQKAANRLYPEKSGTLRQSRYQSYRLCDLIDTKNLFFDLPESPKKSDQKWIFQANAFQIPIFPKTWRTNPKRNKTKNADVLPHSPSMFPITKTSHHPTAPAKNRQVTQAAEVRFVILMKSWTKAATKNRRSATKIRTKIPGLGCCSCCCCCCCCCCCWGWEEKCCGWFRNPAEQLRLVVYPSLSHFLHGFIHHRW